MPSQQTVPLSVSDVVHRLKRLIEENFESLVVEAEISEYRIHGPSGHHYFTLKDEQAVIQAAMWRSSASRLKFRPEIGQVVRCRCKLDIYPPRGTYQLIVTGMQPAGLGDLQRRFEELKEKLQKEGLFENARKKTLPSHPRHLAIVTSPSGAALRDMLRVAANRFPVEKILIAPTLVQGPGAAGDIARAVAELNTLDPAPDLMIVGRGGGSLEDLWAFNEEAVARAVANSDIPVISAVGHETDFTIADFVADVRAATPTEAMVIALPDLEELCRTLDDYERILSRRPVEMMETGMQRTDELQERLTASLRSTISRPRERIENFAHSLHTALPRLLKDRRRRLTMLSNASGFTRLEYRLDLYEQNLSHLKRTAANALERNLSPARRAMENAEASLQALSPKKVLSRGYSITLNEKGKTVKKGDAVSPGSRLTTLLDEGRILSRVEESFAENPANDTMPIP